MGSFDILSFVADILGILGGIVLLFEIVSRLRHSFRFGTLRHWYSTHILEPYLKKLRGDLQFGKPGRWYTAHILPYLLGRAYEEADIELVNRYLVQINIGKLASAQEAIRKTAIQQLVHLPASSRSFEALVEALRRERSPTLRRAIVKALDATFSEE